MRTLKFRNILAVTAFAVLTPAILVAWPAPSLADNPFDSVPPATHRKQASARVATPPDSVTETISAATPFPALLSAYLASYRRAQMTSRQDLRHVSITRAINSAIFGESRGESRGDIRDWRKASPSARADYIAKLRQIDALSSHSPEAIADLAGRLQTSWEAIFQLGTSAQLELHQAIADDGARVGTLAAVASYTLLGAWYLTHPTATPRYFALVRHLFPLAGTWSGAAAASAVNAARESRSDLPPAPAQVMRLGLAWDDHGFDYQKILRELSVEGGSWAAGAIAFDLLEGVQWVSAPAKVNPVALAGSLALGALAHQGIESAIEYVDEKTFTARLLSSRDAMLAALRIHDRIALIRATDRFARDALNLAHLSDYGLWEARVRLKKQERAAAEEFGLGSSAYRGHLEQYERRFDSEVEAALAERGTGPNEAVRVRRLLETQLGASPSEAVLDSIRSRIAEQEARLADQTRVGRLADHPDELLLQCAAFTHSMNDAYLDNRADELLASLAANDLLARETFARAASEEAFQRAAEQRDSQDLRTRRELPPGGVPIK